MSDTLTANSTVTSPLSTAEQLVGKILELQEKLQQQAPGYESLLHTIHSNLSKDPDLVHLLTNEQIGIICLGLQKRTGVEMSKIEAKKKTSSKEKVSLADL